MFDEFSMSVFNVMHGRSNSASTNHYIQGEDSPTRMVICSMLKILQSIEMAVPIALVPMRPDTYRTCDRCLQSSEWERLSELGKMLLAQNLYDLIHSSSQGRTKPARRVSTPFVEACCVDEMLLSRTSSEEVGRFNEVTHCRRVL